MTTAVTFFYEDGSQYQIEEDYGIEEIKDYIDGAKNGYYYEEKNQKDGCYHNMKYVKRIEVEEIT